MKLRGFFCLLVCMSLVVGCMPKDNIFKAATNGDLARVKELLDGYPDLMMRRDPNGMTPMMWAAGKGHTDIVEYLISKGADVNTANYSGRTALHHAAFYGHLDVVKLLLSKGADPNIKNIEQKTALESAQKGNHQDIVDALRPVTKQD